MKTKLLSLFLIIFSCGRVNAQGFIGYVKKADSTASPIFQAKVEIMEGDKPFKSLKTYFDGSFKFTPNKNQTYSIKITYPGYTDSTYTITSDKNGKTDMTSVAVILKKDGMRLMGVIKSREEDFPIKGATIVLKNVMTRREDRITTDIDGRYNFKLEYETNYKVWLDKRSPGIFNLYKDTSFYISTIGFNQPLDYKLDISLEVMPFPLTPVREGYDATKQPLNRNVKSEIKLVDSEEKSHVVLPKDTSIVSGSNSGKGNGEAVKEFRGKLKNIPEESSQAREASKELKEKPEATKDKEESQKESLDSIAASTEKKAKTKKGKERLEVVIIQDTVRIPSANLSVDNEKSQPLSELEIVRQKALAEKRAREIETQIAIKKAAEEKKRTEEIARQKAEEEQLAAKRKLTEDSILRAKQKNDSPVVVNAGKQKIQTDSISRVKQSLQQKIVGDSADAAKTFYLTKTQEELVAAAEMFAKRKRLAEDSIAKLKGSESKKTLDLKKDK